MSVPLPPALYERPLPGGAWSAWLDALPRLIDELLARWHLTPDGDARAGRATLVLPVLDADGVRRAFKVAFPNEDDAGEIPTLQLWAGRHAARLLRADPHRRALLLEWLEHPLAELPAADESTDITAGLYRHLHRPAAPQLPDVHPRVNRWLDHLAAHGRSIQAPPHLIQQAIIAGGRLAAAPGTHVLHGDLHDRNVMGRGDSWVAIDPKGYNGDPCFEPPPLLWNRWAALEASDNLGEAIRDRFYEIVDTAELDERRSRDWVIVRCIINVARQITDPDRPAAPATTPHEWITRNITIAKAMQGIAAP